MSKKRDLRIVQFDQCNHIALKYKNLLLNFNPDGFLTFTSSFEKLNFDERAVLFPDGTSRLVMHTRCQEIQLCFDHSEFQAMSEALQEAAVMLEVHQILSYQ
ncbi:hypothetical protein J6I44_11865 [Aliifodinibius sp. 1BSP15-2V2]|uniref:Uncharacterized protein n=1 Tax=Fodinibius salsisoli TaxID=2820877 RepID=A0ABT3PNX8_9BACT|nr:DUF6686 family protein [Fodinibius salsisoli]MCW9707553.1 hypothetical protein [Fodinibius salsisoli]